MACMSNLLFTHIHPPTHTYTYTHTHSQYPELENTEKEVQMLNRLYNLYVSVITTIRVRLAALHLFICNAPKLMQHMQCP